MNKQVASVELEKILSTLRKDLHDAWDKYSSYDDPGHSNDLEAYGADFDRAYSKAKVAIDRLIAQTVVNEFTALIEYLDGGAIDDITSRRWIVERVGELRAYRSVG